MSQNKQCHNSIRLKFSDSFLMELTFGINEENFLKVVCGFLLKIWGWESIIWK